MDQGHHASEGGMKRRDHALLLGISMALATLPPAAAMAQVGSVPPAAHLGLSEAHWWSWTSKAAARDGGGRRFISTGFTGRVGLVARALIFP